MLMARSTARVVLGQAQQCAEPFWNPSATMRLKDMLVLVESKPGLQNNIAPARRMGTPAA